MKKWPTALIVGILAGGAIVHYGIDLPSQRERDLQFTMLRIASTYTNLHLAGEVVTPEHKQLLAHDLGRSVALAESLTARGVRLDEPYPNAMSFARDMSELVADLGLSPDISRQFESVAERLVLDAA